jgi:hypothetical protein
MCACVRRTFLHVLARRALAEDLREPPLQRLLLLLLLLLLLRSRRIRRRRGAVVVGISGIHCAVLTRSRRGGIARGIGPGRVGRVRAGRRCGGDGDRVGEVVWGDGTGRLGRGLCLSLSCPSPSLAHEA